MRLSRRSAIRSGLLAAAAPFLDRLGLPSFGTAARAQQPEWLHGLSLFGELKYSPGFKHFDYVNPQAPKGGAARLIAFGTYDNFNLAVAGVKGSLSAGITFIYNQLMADALDEVSTEYGLLAEAVSYPADFSSVTYRLRTAAKWHDGKPVTVEDVIFTLAMFKKHHPQYAAYYRHVTKAEKTGERDITFTFDGPGNRELPQIVGQIYVLPKHWWEGTDASGKKRDIGTTTLEPPLGSGPYRVKEFVPGRTIVYERVKDYWGKDLNVNVGRDNFDELRFEYFRDSTVAIEAFKADHIDWRTENSAKNWATAYDFPAVKDKRVILEEFPTRSTGIMQAFVFNTRRDKFKDPRVRRAFNFAFDFEEMNKQIFFGQYKRIASYFEGTELASSGVPQGQELAILETVRSEVPPELFTTPYTNPVARRAGQGARQPARGGAADEGSGLRGARPQADQRQDRRAADGGVLERGPELRAGHSVLQALARAPRRHRDGAHGGRRPIREPAAQLGLRHDRRLLGAVAVARQRAARLLGLAGGRPGGVAQPRRHQESGRRRADRARHFREEPRRAARRHQGARPGVAVELLRRTAMDLRQGADGALGPLRAAQ